MDTPTSGYVYIATSDGLANSYVGVSASLLDMEWIAKYGVDSLVWFEGYADVALAQARADQLADMSEDQRRCLFLNSNPTQADLSPRIWGSDEEEA
jgi:predicted GIY-YIG superfamily endonuclease